MNTHLTTQERCALAFILAVTCLGLFLPAIYQPENYHHFADQRAWIGIPHFADVVSNLIFMAAGAIGLYRLKVFSYAQDSIRLPLMIFFTGLLLTGPGSAYYHWSPNVHTILVDRLPMVIAFAGIIGTFLARRVSVRAGLVGLMASLAIGGAGLAISAVSGNLALYLALQFGGLTGLILGLRFFKNCDDGYPWRALIGWYVLAKMLELGDHVIWDLTQHLVSGHTLKHLAAGMSGLVLLRVLSVTSGQVPFVDAHTAAKT